MFTTAHHTLRQTLVKVTTPTHQKERGRMLYYMKCHAMTVIVSIMVKQAEAYKK